MFVRLPGGVRPRLGHGEPLGGRLEEARRRGAPGLCKAAFFPCGPAKGASPSPRERSRLCATPKAYQSPVAAARRRPTP
ncbi:pre-mRNA processing splicing factor PRP8 [Thermus thermophilus]|nr:pre-mRNA processing splicing factor PRP8 [Thermus thermophilus]